jgi:ribosomal protein S18 acetylase RimI-like enzyme
MTVEQKKQKNVAQGIKIFKADHHQLRLITPLFDAYRVFYQQPSDMHAARKFLAERLNNHESTIYFAADKQQMTAYGFVQLYTKFSSISLSKILILNDLYVCENHRKKGIGSLLMTKTKEHAIENGFAKIVLETAPANQIAQALYLSHGYTNQEKQFINKTLDLTK